MASIYFKEEGEDLLSIVPDDDNSLILKACKDFEYQVYRINLTKVESLKMAKAVIKYYKSNPHL